MRARFSRFFPVLLATVVSAGLIGCRPPPPPPPPSSGPATNAITDVNHPNVHLHSGVGLLSGNSYWINVTVNPGPSRWCYDVQSCTDDTHGTNLMVPPEGIPGVFFTNVQVTATACTVTNLASGWTVAANSHFTFVNTSGSRQMQFCLDCPESTNGEISIVVTTARGTNVTVGPVAGPRP